jgi:hypothetical protein
MSEFLSPAELAKLLESDPTLAEKVKATVRDHEDSQDQPEAAFKTPQYILLDVKLGRVPGDSCRVSNGFEMRQGTVIRRAGPAWVVRVADDLLVVAHEAEQAWQSNL